MSTQTRSSFAAWYALGALTITTLYAVIDRQVVLLLTQPLKADLHLSDAQIGGVHGVGAVLFAALATIPLGWLADRYDRRAVLCGCILFWTMAIASCGLASNFWTLLLSVSLLGAGEAGLSPIVYSMIPDLFSESQRMKANFIYYSALVLGSGAGLALSGLLIDHIGAIIGWLPASASTLAHWRLVFFVVAVPGPFLALLIAFIRLKATTSKSDVAKQAHVAPAEERPPFLPYLARHWKAILGTFGGYGMALLGSSAAFVWMPVLLMRKFGITPGQVGTGFGAAVTGGSIAGLLLAPLLAKFLKARWGEATPLRMPQYGFVTFALLCPLYLIASSPTHIFLIVGLQLMANIAATSLSPTIYQSLAPAKLRGRIFSFSIVIATTIQAASPVLIGLLSDHVFLGNAGLMFSSIAVSIPCMLLAATLFRFSEKHVLATVAEVKALEAAA